MAADKSDFNTWHVDISSLMPAQSTRDRTFEREKRVLSKAISIPCLLYLLCNKYIYTSHKYIYWCENFLTVTYLVVGLLR